MVGLVDGTRANRNNTSCTCFSERNQSDSEALDNSPYLEIIASHLQKPT